MILIIIFLKRIHMKYKLSLYMFMAWNMIEYISKLWVKINVLSFLSFCAYPKLMYFQLTKLLTFTTLQSLTQSWSKNNPACSPECVCSTNAKVACSEHGKIAHDLKSANDNTPNISWCTVVCIGIQCVVSVLVCVIAHCTIPMKTSTRN